MTDKPRPLSAHPQTLPRAKYFPRTGLLVRFQVVTCVRFPPLSHAGTGNAPPASHQSNRGLSLTKGSGNSPSGFGKVHNYPGNFRASTKPFYDAYALRLRGGIADGRSCHAKRTDRSRPCQSAEKGPGRRCTALFHSACGVAIRWIVSVRDDRIHFTLWLRAD